MYRSCQGPKFWAWVSGGILRLGVEELSSLSPTYLSRTDWFRVCHKTQASRTKCVWGACVSGGTLGPCPPARQTQARNQLAIHQWERAFATAGQCSDPRPAKLQGKHRQAYQGSSEFSPPEEGGRPRTSHRLTPSTWSSGELQRSGRSTKLETRPNKCTHVVFVMFVGCRCSTRAAQGSRSLHRSPFASTCSVCWPGTKPPA